MWVVSKRDIVSAGKEDVKKEKKTHVGKGIWVRILREGKSRGDERLKNEGCTTEKTARERLYNAVRFVAEDAECEGRRLSRQEKKTVQNLASSFV